mmetsp:Transcript_5517/g.11630  ORF Transcript_5517/g.11630 Transcript_5517/m.11630 type:complete len:272 (+) Transcript_5517:379-1194(+)
MRKPGRRARHTVRARNGFPVLHAICEKLRLILSRSFVFHSANIFHLQPEPLVDPTEQLAVVVNERVPDSVVMPPALDFALQAKHLELETHNFVRRHNWLARSCKVLRKRPATCTFRLERGGIRVFHNRNAVAFVRNIQVLHRSLCQIGFRELVRVLNGATVPVHVHGLNRQMELLAEVFVLVDCETLRERIPGVLDKLHCRVRNHRRDELGNFALQVEVLLRVLSRRETVLIFRVRLVSYDLDSLASLFARFLRGGLCHHIQLSKVILISR